MTSSHLQIPTPSTPSGWKPSLPSTKATPPTPLRSWQMCLDLAGTTTLLGVKKQAVKQQIVGIAVWFQVNKVDKSQVKVKSSSYRPIDRYLLSIGKSILKCPIKVEPNCNGAHFLGNILIKKYLGKHLFLCCSDLIMLLPQLCLPVALHSYRCVPRTNVWGQTQSREVIGW